LAHLDEDLLAALGHGDRLKSKSSATLACLYLEGNLLAGGHSGQFHEALSAQEGE
jgi:hypothetical protein